MLGERADSGERLSDRYEQVDESLPGEIDDLRAPMPGDEVEAEAGERDGDDGVSEGDEEHEGEDEQEVEEHEHEGEVDDGGDNVDDGGQEVRDEGRDDEESDAKSKLASSSVITASRTLAFLGRPFLSD